MKKRVATAAVFLRALATGRTRRLYKTDEIVFAQGDAADAVFYVERGSVCVTAVSAHGKQADIVTLRRGAFFGESCLGVSTVRTSSARACEPSAFVRVDRDAMASLLHREPAFADLFTAYILSRSVRSEQDLIANIFLSSEKRLAAALLSMSGLGTSARPAAVTPRVTDDGLALMLGLSRSYVRELMEGFRKAGYIAKSRGGLQVTSGLLGVVLHE
jgi:CRP-like cAMP-binding protein